MKKYQIILYVSVILFLVLPGWVCPERVARVSVRLLYPEYDQVVCTPDIDFWVDVDVSGAKVPITKFFYIDDNDDGVFEVYERGDVVLYDFPLTPSTTYHWYVFARPTNHSQHEGDTSDIWTFTTCDSFIGQGMAHTPHPDSGATDVDSMLVVSWSVYIPPDSDPPDTYYRCDLYFGTNIDPPLIIANTGRNFYDVRPLSGNTMYYWRVVSYSQYGDTVEGPLWNFTTIAAEIPTVHSPNPADGAFNFDSSASLSWEYYDPTGGPTQFDVYLGTATDPPLAATALSSPSYTPPTLSGGTGYFWRVVIYNAYDTVSGPEWSFTTIYSESEDVFALFEIDVMQAASGYHVNENYHARFDTGVAVSAPIEPLQAGGVNIGGADLIWRADSSHYSYEEMSMPYIENGQPVNISVTAGADVPALSTAYTFPACSLAITYPQGGLVDNVPISGFEVLWDGSECGGTAYLLLMDGADSTGVLKQVANDGADSLTAADLAPLGGTTGQYDLYLFKIYEENVSASGYVPGSLIRTRIINRQILVNIVSSPVSE
ncbi:MAG: hypothetical protein R3F48_07645 [Candidatus Zixiibacteriota bacterium]